MISNFSLRQIRRNQSIVLAEKPRAGFAARRGKRAEPSPLIRRAGEFWRRKLRRQILPSRLTFPSASRVRGLLDGYLCISLFLSPVKAVLRGGASPWHSAPRRACHHVSALEAHSHTALRHDDVADGRADAGWNTNTLTQAYRKCIMRRAALPCKQGAMELQPRSRPCSREYAPQLRALAARIAERRERLPDNRQIRVRFPTS